MSTECTTKCDGCGRAAPSSDVEGLWYEVSTVRWFREGFGTMHHGNRHACSAECVKAVLIDVFADVRRDQTDMAQTRARRDRKQSEEERRAREEARRVSDGKIVGEVLWDLFGGGAA